MKIQLLTFPGCPSAGAARRLLNEVVEAMRVPVDFEEIDVHSDGCPPELRHWGSPTILVDGVDVTSGKAQAGTACRLYPQEGGGIQGVPSAAELRAALEKARSCCAVQDSRIPQQKLESRPGGRLAIVISSLAAATAGIVAALTSACCAGPVVVALLGTTGAITAAGLAPYRGYLLLVAFGLLGFAFWRMYLFQRGTECCPSGTDRWARWIFWFCAITTVIAAVFPLWMEG